VANAHPVHNLRANLESARLKAVQALAATDGAVSSEALRELCIIQAALTAVQEEIDAHGGRLGWGTGIELT
jgi:hypothetical protein